MPTHPRLLLLAALLCGPTLGAQQHTLRLRLAEGTTLRYVATTELVMNMTMPRKQDTQMRVAIHFDLRIGGDAGPAGQAVALTVRRLEIKLDNPPLSRIDYDSDNKQGDAGLLHELTTLVGKSLAMRLDARGRLGHVELPKDFPPAAAKLFGGDLAQFFADNIPELPEAAVSVGDRWQTSSSMPLQQTGSTTIVADNHLEGVHEQRATVQQTLQIDAGALAPDKEAKAEVVLAEGRYGLDLQRGVLTDATTTIDVHTTGKQHAMPLDVRHHLVRSLRLLADAAPGRPGEAK